MDTKKIEKLILLMKKHGLHEIEVEEENVGKVRVTAAASYAPAGMYAPPPGSYSAAASGAKPSESHSDDSAATVARDKQIRSPFVGTFYEAASPEAEPFVRTGQKVRKGETLCIIEAMKIMNEIEADRDCTIKEVLVKNGQPLEFDQVIFIIE